MNEINNYKNRIFSVVAVFLFGNLIITFPKGEGQQQSFWGYILCCAVCFAIANFLIRLQNSSENFCVHIFDKTVNNNLLKNILKILLLLFSLLCFIICTKDYIVMVDSIRLKTTPRFILSAVFVFTIFVLSNTQKRVIYMFAFVNLILITLGVLIMLVFSLSAFDLTYIIDSLDFNLKNTITQGLTFYIHSFGQIILCLLFVGHIEKKDAKKNVFLGILFGGIIFLICFLNVILMVGNEIIVKLRFPYAAVTGMIVSGDAYNRLDAITYYIYFICDLIKASILLRIITEIYSKKQWLKWSVSVLTAVLAVVFSSNSSLGLILQGKPVNFVLLCLEIVLPISIGVLIYRSKTTFRRR